MFAPAANSPDDRELSIDNAKRELKEASEEFWETSGPLPEQLFHYCSADALRSILAGRELWLSDVFTLNDASEMEYAADVVDRVLQRYSNRPRWLPCHLHNSKLREVFPLYVACFCSHGDLLSQWRGYATAGSGFAIGLDRERLKQHCTHNDVLFPFPVTYDGERQTRAVEQFVERAVHIASKYNLIDNDCFKEDFGFHLSKFLLGMKNPCFAEEREWRILRIDPEPPCLKFRTARGIIIPYIELSTIPPDVFASVTLGPAIDAKFTIKPVELFLKHNHLEHVELRLSKIPLRTLRY